MHDTIGMTAHLARQAARAGWYYGISRLLARQTQSARTSAAAADFKPQRPVPKFQDLLTDLGKLILEDAKAVRDGRYPSMPEAGDDFGRHVSRVRGMIADVPVAMARKNSKDTGSVRTAHPTDLAGLPDYYTQDFHFQTGGYLSADSARLYDVQVETLFMGAGGPMRRRALSAIVDAVRGRDQRRLQMLDVACGTGRFLRQVRLTFPRLGLTGMDLSTAYLAEAQAGFRDLTGAAWLEANAERIPLGDASQDIVTCIFLFHELPPEVRRQVAKELARVLKPGGRLVFMDSLQIGDKLGWDGLLEAFPVRFHEPYFRSYAIDDLDSVFRQAGLVPIETTTPFLAKLMVCRKV